MLINTVMPLTLLQNFFEIFPITIHINHSCPILNCDNKHINPSPNFDVTFFARL